MTNPSTPQLVGVIFTRADLQRAVRMRNPPDLFELRLDALMAKSAEVESALADLRVPLIITARHPREGGSNCLSARERRALLLRFLPYAAYVDIELRAAGSLRAILDEARARSIRTILSFHDFRETPSRARFDEIARAARSLGADLLKIATRTDTPVQLARLLDFFQEERLKIKIAAMGIGRLGRISRLEFARHHSALNYAHLGRAQAKGQLSIAQLRRILQ
ncbi:MAG: 3-dehydroquinate dehydratase [Verrucomicrobiota bacterium]|jgi:3-dehydroquinate dehydratase-1